MKIGALIMAFNNEHYDYVKLAAYNAERIRRFLKIPVTIVTDSINVPDKFDDIIRIERPDAEQRYFPDIKTNVNWFNSNRVDAFELTPYDRTLLLDADFLINSSNLSWPLATSRSFLCFNKAHDLTKTTDFVALNTMGLHQFPMHWATVIIFQRDHHSKFVFDSMQMIRDNWEHYRNIYKIDRPTYRNDFALTIALGIVSGHTMNVDNISYSMPTVTPEHKLSLSDKDVYKVEFKVNNKPKHIMFTNMDFHAMGKRDLGELIDNQN